MRKLLTQPKVERYYEWLRKNDHFGMTGCIYDDESNVLLDELFSLMDQISPVSSNGVRSLWLRAERGPIDDFGNPAEEVSEGNYESEEDFISEWKWLFPDEVAWYLLQTVELKDEGYRAISLKHHFVIVQDNRRKPSGFPNAVSEFVQWIIDEVRVCIDMLKAGTYNDLISSSLPPQHRTGTILRKDFWAVWPEVKAEFFENISQEDTAEFIQKASLQGSGAAAVKKRLHAMSANDFFRFCAMGYAANNYAGCDRTPKEQYYLHADGRDEGLRELDPDDPVAFRNWLHDRTHGGGHPWEICRGGNSTHISLQPVDDENGFILYLAGDAWTRTVETVKFFLELTRADVPVVLMEASTLAARMSGNEKMGIVPEGVISAYCESWFPNEHIIDYMNLPDEDRERFLPYCTWYDETPATLIQKEGNNV